MTLIKNSKDCKHSNFLFSCCRRYFRLFPSALQLRDVTDIYEEIVKLRGEGGKGALATIINVRGSIRSFQSAKMLVRDDGSILGTVGGGCVEAEVWQAAREVIEKERPTTLTFNLNHDPKYDTGLVCGGTLEIYVEPVLPTALLYLFGGGHVAVNVYKIALQAGFYVIVVDDRETHSKCHRFSHPPPTHPQHFIKTSPPLFPTTAN